MSHWLARSVLALLCFFSSALASAGVQGQFNIEPAATAMVAEPAASPSSPELPFAPAGNSDVALVDALHELVDAKGDGTTLDNVDLVSGIALRDIERGNPAMPDGRDGLSFQTPYLSKLRRPPRG